MDKETTKRYQLSINPYGFFEDGHPLRSGALLTLDEAVIPIGPSSLTSASILISFRSCYIKFWLLTFIDLPVGHCCSISQGGHLRKRKGENDQNRVHSI